METTAQEKHCKARYDQQVFSTTLNWTALNDYLDRLSAAVSSKQAILILGTGVSKALSGGAGAADWIGLLRDGIKRLVHRSELQSWGALQEMALDDALERDDLDGLLGVASQISAKLRAPGSQAYSDWLRDSVGSLRVVRPELAISLEQLELPILTTNYDQLIEKALRRTSIDWTDAESMREVFKGETPSVGHLHGVWNRPNTVVLSESDYTRVMHDQPGQFVQQAHYSTKSFIYVGFGSGLHDPNFSRLLKRHSVLFPDSRGDHFRLCLSSELSQLESAHAEHDIRVISYGHEYEDLAPFIDSLRGGAPSAKTPSPKRDNLAFAREAILEPIRSETVVGSHLDDVADCDLADLTVPPVLLPVPHEQFASMQDLDDDLKPRRLDVEAMYKESKLLILAGEELSGLTTALRWVVAKASFMRPGVAPVFVDSRNCTQGKTPLENQVRRESLLHRLIDHKKDALPDHVLAVDNLLPRDSTTYQQILDDLLDSSADFIVIGTKQGEEQRLAQDLQEHGLGVEIAYVGKLGRPEIQSLAQIVAPKRSETIADGVWDVLRREHLSRNPFTISLLVSLFVQIGGASTHSSETAVLDDYVSLLLGRNGPYLDARYSLNPQNRETVLAELAKEFVNQKKGALAQDDALRSIADYFSSVGWKENPIEALESFRDMRVLRISSGLVQFQQSSYLHLFAAKAAIRDDVFLSKLFEDPVFYAPIVRHYAALVRNSERAVHRIEQLLTDWPAEAPTGHIFGQVEKSAAPEELGRLFEGPVPSEDVEEESGTPGNTSVEDVAEDDYDYSDDTDMVPFPLEDPSKLSRSQRMVGVVDLASRVLRDSDQMPNLALKSAVLKQVFRAWGATLDALEGDAIFEEPARAIVDGVVAEGNIKPEKTDDMVARIAMFIPSFVIFSGVSACLSSRKLLVTYENVVQDEEFSMDEYGLPMAAMFAFDVQERGWAKYLPELVRLHGDRWIVSEFIGMLATVAFRQQELTPYDENDLKKFLRERTLRRYTFDSDGDRTRRIAKYEQDLVRDRALHRRQRLAPGTTTAEKVLEGPA
ncbi:SIR2 family protein [Arthrobacter sp. NPDC056691]|uniref:SIR2 family protein n=1 Tax=Arthrobacter sp. NPDC056691 TaxID=3345913 RepID=UPI00366B9195